MNETFPTSLAELLARIETAWAELLAFIEPLSPAQLGQRAPGQWSVQDNLAHIAAWERYALLRHLQKRPGYEVLGIEQAQLKGMDIDQINAALHAGYQDLTPAEALTRLRQTHTELIAAVAATGFEALQAVEWVEDNGEEHCLMESIINNTYDHYREHLETMRRELDERA